MAHRKLSTDDNAVQHCNNVTSLVKNWKLARNCQYNTNAPFLALENQIPAKNAHNIADLGYIFAAACK
jgi:hypothetical protein